MKTKFLIGSFTESLRLKKGSRLCGYPNTEERHSKGSKEDLEVNGIILKSGKRLGLIVSVDIIGISISFTSLIRKKINREFGIPEKNIIIACTHTHSSGVTVEHWRQDNTFLKEIENKIMEGVEKGMKNFEEVKMGVLEEEIDISHNRRVLKNGKVVNEWQDPEGKHKGIVDKKIGIVVFSTHKGIKSIILNYSCHPVVMGPSNFYASADFIGYLRKYLRKRLKVENIIYTTGSAGDINPKICLTDKFSIAKKTGEAIGRTVYELIKRVKLYSVKNFNVERIRITFTGKEKGKIRSEIQILNLDEVCFVTLPGEPLVEIGLNIKRKSKFKHTYIIGYANDYIGYISPNKVLKEGVPITELPSVQTVAPLK